MRVAGKARARVLYSGARGADAVWLSRPCRLSYPMKHLESQDSNRGRMIQFHPKAGMLLMCDFNTGFKPPEMVKVRPVVVIACKGNQLATVVPVSTVEPIPCEAWHYEMTRLALPKCFQSERCWAKCDMLSCVAFWRLDRVRGGSHPRTGKPNFVSPRISEVDLANIRQALRSFLGF